MSILCFSETEKESDDGSIGLDDTVGYVSGEADRIVKEINGGGKESKNGGKGAKNSKEAKRVMSLFSWNTL